MTAHPHQISPSQWPQWEHQFESKIAQITFGEDPAHDLLHFKRVVALAKKICAKEYGSLKLWFQHRGFMIS